MGNRRVARNERTNERKRKSEQARKSVSMEAWQVSVKYQVDDKVVSRSLEREGPCWAGVTRAWLNGKKSGVMMTMTLDRHRIESSALSLMKAQQELREKKPRDLAL